MAEPLNPCQTSLLMNPLHAQIPHLAGPDHAEGVLKRVDVRADDFVQPEVFVPAAAHPVREDWNSLVASLARPWARRGEG